MARRAGASTDNFRTAGGRRVRAVRQARALAAHLDAKEEKATAKLKAKREKLEKVQNLGKVKENKHDPEYQEDRSELGESVRNAVKETVQVQVKPEKVKTKTNIFFDTDIESDTGESS